MYLVQSVCSAGECGELLVSAESAGFEGEPLRALDQGFASNGVPLSDM